MIPREKLDEITNRIDLVSLITEYVPLKKSGSNYKGLCPFHEEKTPSFMVSPEKQIFHCFGCGEGGNLFGFLMKVESLPFPEAAERLAKRAGVDLGPQEKGYREKQEQKDLLYRINQYAAWFYADNLKKPGETKAREYLKKRGLPLETIEEFRLGLALDGWDHLVRFLRSKKVPLEKAASLGLIKKRKDGSYYDFFRNRLIFPIIDFEERIIGFGGRRLNEEETNEAKYINSAESLIYHKGNSIYGLSQAKKALREKKRGYFSRRIYGSYGSL